MTKGVHLFLFPHQDDEAPVFHEIESLVARQETVLIAYLTSGDLSGQPAPTRNAESLRALHALGVTADQVHFLGTRLSVPDGQLAKHLDAVLPALQQAIPAHGRLASVHMPAWEGGHQDHDAAHLLGAALARQFNCLDSAWQFPYYHGQGLPGILFRTLSPLPGNGPAVHAPIAWGRRLKYLRLLALYRSQLGSWVGLGPFFALHYLFRGTQVRQKISMQRLRERPHEGPMLYERRRFSDYASFSLSVGPFLARHLPD